MLNIWVLIAIGVVLTPILSKYAKSIEEKIEEKSDKSGDDKELEGLKKRTKLLQQAALILFLIIAAALAFITRKMLPPM